MGYYPPPAFQFKVAIAGSNAEDDAAFSEVSGLEFDALGIPLRAKLTPSFEQFLDPCDLAKLSAKSSPDMTHLREAVAGGTLPLMCQRIYGDSRHYLSVADHNGLADFRDLRPGQTIAFPQLTERAA